MQATNGFATQQQLGDWRVPLDEWKSTPGAWGGLSFGEVLARKPRGWRTVTILDDSSMLELLAKQQMLI